MTEAEIRSASGADADRVAGLIAEAFDPLALTRWLVPDDSARTGALHGQFVMLVDHAIRHGAVHVIDNGTGTDAAAVWLPPDAPHEIEDYDRRLAVAAGPWLARFQALDAAMADAHPPAPPHHHLVFLAVRPQRQGAGLGTALLHHHHRVLDAGGTAAYLEASSRRSAALYERHGYRHIDRPFAPEEGAPVMWPMLRTAGPPATAPAG